MFFLFYDLLPLKLVYNQTSYCALSVNQNNRLNIFAAKETGVDWGGWAARQVWTHYKPLLRCCIARLLSSRVKTNINSKIFMNHLDVLTLKANADKFNIAFKQKINFLWQILLNLNIAKILFWLSLQTFYVFFVLQIHSTTQNLNN